MTDTELSARVEKITAMAALLAAHLDYLPQPERSALRQTVLKIIKPQTKAVAA